MNVICVSSDYLFPYRVDNWKELIYAGEVSPKDMYQLLTVKWGIELNVAAARMNIYGGHIYDIKIALRLLYLEKEKLDFFFNSSASHNVQKCLRWKFKEKRDNLRMRETLRQMAIKGFVPLVDIEDPVTNVINEYNVRGVIGKSSKTVGLSRQVWKGNACIYGIVASKQSMRLVIAKILGHKEPMLSVLWKRLVTLLGL